MSKSNPAQPTSGQTIDLERWFEHSPGRELMSAETRVLEQIVRDKFGYYLLQVGALGHQTVLPAATGLRTKICLLSKGVSSPDGLKTIAGDPDSLPVASDSVDLVVLPHVLEFANDPHQVLREVERILIPEGNVVIFGFSPWSFWGMWRLFHRRSKPTPWCGHFISPQRMRDWLSLLGFDINQCDGMMFRPPLKHQGLMSRLRGLERMGGRFWPLFSGVYAIHAVKRVSKLTPIKPHWKLRTKRLKGQVVEPAARSWKRV